MNKIINIGITGGFGFLGSNLIKFIHELNKSNLNNNNPDSEFYNLFCFYSSNKNNPLINDIEKNEITSIDDNKDFLKLKLLHLNILNPNEVSDKVKNLDVLFHIAGIVDFRKFMKKNIWDVNVIGTSQILDACIKNKIPKLIYTSSINVLGLPAGKKEFADENNTPYMNKENPNYFKSGSECLEAIQKSLNGDYSFLKNIKICYYDSKLSAYELVKKYNRNYDMDIITVFPGTIIGAGDIGDSITDLIVKIFNNKMYFTSTGTTSWVTAQDAARGLYLAYKNGSPKENYLISGNENENLKYSEFMNLTAKTLSGKYSQKISKNFKTINPAAMSKILKLNENIFTHSKLSNAFLIAGSMNHKFTIEKARRELNYQPQQPVKDAIIECFEFYRTNKNSFL